MRFLADENIPGDAVTELETAGHDIVWVRTVAPGSKDEDVLALAVREERIILTFHTTTKPRPNLATPIIIKRVLSSIWIAAFAKILT
jgi:hypothetical protein